MLTTNSADPRITADHLHQFGYVFLAKWRPEDTTIAIGRSIGSVVDIRSLLPQSIVPSIQTLEPSTATASLSNRYSGTYGLDPFPLHTDLAHWALPPRYLVLRCQTGSKAVDTSLFDSRELHSWLADDTIRRALVRPRNVGANGKLLLLPLSFSENDVLGFRWDPLFLLPMNDSARKVAQIISTEAWDQSNSLTLLERGDTLVVDNWRFLHGRSKVPPAGITRKLERVYLSEVFA